MPEETYPESSERLLNASISQSQMETIGRDPHPAPVEGRRQEEGIGGKASVRSRTVYQNVVRSSLDGEYHDLPGEFSGGCGFCGPLTYQ